VTIGATAIAQVSKLPLPCVLALVDQLQIQGSTTVKSNCGVTTNDKAKDAITFTGNNGIDISKVASFSALGGCHENGSTYCSNATTYLEAPTTNPLSGLNTPLSSLNTGTANFKDGACTITNGQPVAYDATITGHQCYNDIHQSKGKNDTTAFNFASNTSYPMEGVYFFNGPVSIGANTSLTLPSTCTLTSPNPPCGVTLILLPGSTLTLTGGPTIKLTALTTVSTSQVPPALASLAGPNGLLSDLLIYDPETTPNQPVKIQGNSASYFAGVTYVPNGDVKYTGGSSTSNCVEVIAKGITLAGNSTLDNSGCPASITGGIPTQYVRLVQ
jgi:hypothetical protein